jgi:hypothetical protein
MASVSAPAGRRPLEPIVAAAAVLCLVLWPVEIHTAFGLPAHPLILHVPVIFVPLLGLAAIALAVWPRERFLLPVAAFSVVTLAATLLTAGAGEAFQADRKKRFGAPVDATLQNHMDAGRALRLTAVLLAATAVFFAVRAGHLGAKLVWGDGGPPPASQRGR